MSNLFCFTSEKVPTQKGQNLFPKGANSFPLDKNPFQKGLGVQKQANRKSQKS